MSVRTLVPPRAALRVDAVETSGAVLLAGAAGVGVAVAPRRAVEVTVLVLMLRAVVARPVLLPAFLLVLARIDSVRLTHGLSITWLGGALALFAIAVTLLAAGGAGDVPHGIYGALLLLGVWIMATGLWAADIGLVLRALVTFAVAVVALTASRVFLQTVQDVVVFLRVYVASAAFLGILAFTTYVTSDGGTRADAFQGDPNIFAVYELGALPAALALLATDRRLTRALSCATLVIIPLGVVASLSRTGFVILAGLLLLVLFSPYRKFFRQPSEKGMFFALIAVAVVAVAAVGADPLQYRAATIFESKAQDDPGAGRPELWSAAYRGFKERPIGGYGAGNFPLQAPRLLRAEQHIDPVALQVYERSGPHDTYLELAVGTGIVGLLLFLAAVSFGLRAAHSALTFARRRADADAEHVARALLLGMLVVLFGAIFLSLQFSLVLWLLVGAAGALQRFLRARLPVR
jgi:O-antigen ligase